MLLFHINKYYNHFTVSDNRIQVMFRGNFILIITCTAVGK